MATVHNLSADVICHVPLPEDEEPLLFGTIRHAVGEAKNVPPEHVRLCDATGEIYDDDAAAYEVDIDTEGSGNGEPAFLYGIVEQPKQDALAAAKLLALPGNRPFQEVVDEFFATHADIAGRDFATTVALVDSLATSKQSAGHENRPRDLERVASYVVSKCVPELLGQKRFAEKLFLHLEDDEDIFEDLPPALQDDEEVATLAVRMNWRAWEFVSDRLKRHSVELALEALTHRGGGTDRPLFDIMLHRDAFDLPSEIATSKFAAQDLTFRRGFCGSVESETLLLSKFAAPVRRDEDVTRVFVAEFRNARDGLEGVVSGRPLQLQSQCESRRHVLDSLLLDLCENPALAEAFLRSSFGTGYRDDFDIMRELVRAHPINFARANSSLRLNYERNQKAEELEGLALVFGGKKYAGLNIVNSLDDEDQDAALVLLRATRRALRHGVGDAGALTKLYLRCPGAFASANWAGVGTGSGLRAGGMDDRVRSIALQTFGQVAGSIIARGSHEIGPLSQFVHEFCEERASAVVLKRLVKHGPRWRLRYYNARSYYPSGFSLSSSTQEETTLQLLRSRVFQTGLFSLQRQVDILLPSSKVADVAREFAHLLIVNNLHESIGFSLSEDFHKHDFPLELRSDKSFILDLIYGGWEGALAFASNSLRDSEPDVVFAAVRKSGLAALAAVHQLDPDFLYRLRKELLVIGLKRQAETGSGYDSMPRIWRGRRVLGPRQDDSFVAPLFEKRPELRGDAEVLAALAPVFPVSLWQNIFGGNGNDDVEDDASIDGSDDDEQEEGAGAVQADVARPLGDGGMNGDDADVNGGESDDAGRSPADEDEGGGASNASSGSSAGNGDPTEDGQREAAKRQLLAKFVQALCDYTDEGTISDFWRLVLPHQLRRDPDLLQILIDRGKFTDPDLVDLLQPAARADAKLFAALSETFRAEHLQPTLGKLPAAVQRDPDFFLKLMEERIQLTLVQQRKKVAPRPRGHQGHELRWSVWKRPPVRSLIPWKLRRDPAFVRAAAAIDSASAVDLAGSEALASKDFVLELIRRVPGVAASLEDAVRHPRSCVEDLLRRTSRANCRDAEVIMEAVKKNGKCIKFAPWDLKHDVALATAAVSQNGLALQFLPVEMTKSREICLAAVKQNGLALEFCDMDRCRWDGGEGAGEGLEAAGGAADIVYAAVRQNGHALRFARGGRFLSDPELFLLAFKTNPFAMQFAQGFVYAAAGPLGTTSMVSADAQRDFLLRAVRANVHVLAVLDVVRLAVVKEREFMLEVVRSDGEGLAYADPACRADSEICTLAVSNRATALRHVCPSLLNDNRGKELVLKALREVLHQHEAPPRRDRGWIHEEVDGEAEMPEEIEELERIRARMLRRADQQLVADCVPRKLLEEDGEVATAVAKVLAEATKKELVAEEPQDPVVFSPDDFQWLCDEASGGGQQEPSAAPSATL